LQSFAGQVSGIGSRDGEQIGLAVCRVRDDHVACRIDRDICRLLQLRACRLHSTGACDRNGATARDQIHLPVDPASADRIAGIGGANRENVDFVVRRIRDNDIALLINRDAARAVQVCGHRWHSRSRNGGRSTPSKEIGVAG
jgi:hypothetical protein